MKKILFLSQTDISCDPRIIKALNAARSAKYKTLAVGIEEISYSKKIKEFNLPDIRYISNMKLSSKPRLNYLLKYFLAIKANFFFIKYGLSFKPTIIHCNDTFPLLAAMLLKICIRSKIIYDAHELESQRSGIGPITRWITIFLERLCWRNIDELIVVSPSIGNWYENHLGKISKTIILNCPTGSVREHKRTKYLLNYFDIPKQEKIFIYNGNLCEGRGIELLLSVFSKSEFEGNIVFLGYGPLENVIKTYTQNHSNVHWHPAVSYDFIRVVNAGADYGICLIENVSLSDYYCLPNKLFEYLHAGLPVIASNFPDIEKLITETNAGVCVDLDEVQIAAKLKKLSSTDALYKVNKTIMKNYTWKRQEEKLSKIYERLV